MDAVFLARFQFALTIGFHFLFPPTTLGLSMMIVVIEGMFLKTKQEIYKKISNLLIKLLGLVFVIGTATGIVMEFSFGNNWAEYSKMVGDIFGAPLAAEGIFAFFLESVFLGVLVFARKKVSKKAYWWSAFFVFFGSHLSGLWIIIANSWMQTPAGYKLVEGKAVLTNFFEAALNPSILDRYVHVILSGWLTGSIVAAAIASYYLIKGKFTDYAKKLITVAVMIFMVVSLLQLVSGHSSAVVVAKHQPAKLAAFEGLWETTKNAPLSLFGIPNQKDRKTYMAIGLPGMLSFLVSWDTETEIKGLNEFGDDIPPVFLTFMSYHVMIALGSIFILVGLLGLFLFLKKRLWDTKWYHRLLIITTPLVYIAVQTGWMAAEVGRQPWIVYNVMKTSNAISKVVPAWQILFTIIVFTLIYILLFIIFMKIFFKIVKNGPEKAENQGY